MKIKNNVLTDLPLIDYFELKPLQGNLKELSEDNFKKIAKSFKDQGFIAPVFVWKQEDKLYLLDGHQRHRTLVQGKYEIKQRDGEVNTHIPYVEIEAETEQEAKQKLLSISSQYGKVTKEGFDEFSFDLDDEWISEATTFDDWLDVTEVEPSLEELIGEDKNKPAVMKITFDSPEELQKAEIDIQELLDRKYPDAYFSVSAGEL